MRRRRRGIRRPAERGPADGARDGSQQRSDGRRRRGAASRVEALAGRARAGVGQEAGAAGRGGPGACLASRSSAGEQANSGRQRPALIAAPPCGAAPAQAPLAVRPRQWAPAGPSPRPRTAPATRDGGGVGLGSGGAAGRGLWGARVRDGIGGRDLQSSREIPNRCTKVYGGPVLGSGVSGSLHSCAGGRGAARVVGVTSPRGGAGTGG